MFPKKDSVNCSYRYVLKRKTKAMVQEAWKMLVPDTLMLVVIKVTASILVGQLLR